jgi:hypothetical protein
MTTLVSDDPSESRRRKDRPFFRLCSTTVTCGIALTAVVGCADEPSAADKAAGTHAGVKVQYEDDFSYATGGRQIQVDGQDPQTIGDIHCSMYTYGRGRWQHAGTLRLLMIEDNMVHGPDGRLGVLRMEVGSIPAATDYAGFVVYGNGESGEITMPGWTHNGLDLAQLRKTFISFRFRSEHRTIPEHFRMTVNFRFEPEMEGSFEWGADFGTLITTQRWRTMRRPLASAANVDAFLAQVNRTRPERYKLVWRPINYFEPGDTLLIDDVKITIE